MLVIRWRGKMELATLEVIKFGKGNSIQDFYNWCLFILAHGIEMMEILIKTVKLNYWWFSKLPGEVQDHFNNEIDKYIKLTS